jgi:hypothetical protein
MIHYPPGPEEHSLTSRSVQLFDPSHTVSAEVELLSGNLVAMGEVHAHIHKGTFFPAGLASAALAGSASLELFVITPASGTHHVRFAATVGGESRAALFEATTVSANGAAITPQNRNRLSGNSASGQYFSAPTVTADGTPLFDGFISGGSGGNAIGGNAASFEEWILAQSTSYLVRVTNVTAQPIVAALQMDFYDTSLTPYL